MARLGEREREMIEVIYRLWGEKVGQRADGYPEVRVTPQPPEADDRSVFSRVINYRELQNYSAVLLLGQGRSGVGSWVWRMRTPVLDYWVIEIVL